MVTHSGIRKFAKASPTPFVAAFFASNVIASLFLPSLGFAIWTRFEDSVFRYPCIEMFISEISTSRPSMKSCTTFHANFLAAFASCFCALSSSFSDILQTAVFGTPTKIRIKVDVNLQSELDVLLKESLRAKCFHISFKELIITVLLHARDLDHLTVLNFRPQMFFQTSLAELVVAGKTEEFGKFLFFIADIAKKVVFAKRLRHCHESYNISDIYTFR